MFFIRTLPALLLASLSLHSVASEQAEKNWYQVELILFKQPYHATTSSEQWEGWDRSKGGINYDESIEIHYPERGSKVVVEDNTVQSNLEPEHGIVSLKEAESIVAESMRPADPQLEIAPELQPFTFSNISDWELASVYERIKSSEQYELLLHTAWIQPGLSKDEAVSVHIHNHMALVPESGVALGESGDIVQSEAPATAPILMDGSLPLPAMEDTQAQMLPAPASDLSATSYPLGSSFFEQGFEQNPAQKIVQKSEEQTTITFDGTLKVILARYLHVEINLDYAPFGFPQEIGNTAGELVGSNSQSYAISGSSIGLDEDDSPLFYKSPSLEKVLGGDDKVQKVVYRLQDARRMRSKELHYIDHPKIGALIKIIPVERPQADTALPNKAS